MDATTPIIVNPLQRFATFAMEGELGNPETDGACLDPATIFHTQNMARHYEERAVGFQTLAITAMGPMEMAYRCAYMAATALVNVAGIVLDHATIVGPLAAEIRMTAKAAGTRLKAVLDLFDAMAPREGHENRAAEAFITIARICLTEIFDDVLHT